MTHPVSSHGLGDLPMMCKHCPSTEARLEDAYINYNQGDYLFPAHLHVNLVYSCECGGRFVIRGQLRPSELYYGDFHMDGAVCDESAETQKAKANIASLLRTGQKVRERWDSQLPETAEAAVPFQ